MERALRVAIVDDDDIVRRALRRMISSLCFDPVEFATGEAFLAALSSSSFSCALIDMHMPVLNGLEVIVRMRQEGHLLPTIIITGGDLPKMRERCLNAGAADYLVKPVERETISDAVMSLFNKARG
jgi:FixJ family two-component response regulator